MTGHAAVHKPPQPSELIQVPVGVGELERRALALATAPPQLVDDLAGAPQPHLVGNVDTLAVHLAVVAALGLAAPRVALVVARARAALAFAPRSEETRVGKGCVSPCRS